jgi:anti-sigma factor RsiW
MKCEIIESMLLDFVNRELDPVRSDMVWKHLKKCPDCEKEAKEMESTLLLLRQASQYPTGAPEHLSEKHRASIVRAITHPILHWMETHHAVASLVLAVLVIASIVLYLRWTEEHRDRIEPAPDTGDAVSIVYPPPPEPVVSTNQDTRSE